MPSLVPDPSFAVRAAPRPDRGHRTTGARLAALLLAVLIAAVGSVAPAAASGGVEPAEVTLGPDREPTLPAADATVAEGPEADPFGGAPSPLDLPAPDATSADTGSAADGPPDGTQPTVQYEDALTHAADTEPFVPGGKVTVPFTPRSDDGWAIDGTTPRALPAGNATGRVMAAAPQGSQWSARAPRDLAEPATSDTETADTATGPRSAPVDEPAGRPVAGEPLVAALPGTSSDSVTTAASNRLRRQVFGFLPYWTLGDSTTVLDYANLSTIAYFSVGADRNGNLLKKGAKGKPTSGWGGWTSARITSVINAAHRHHTRVVLTISVFAWTDGEAARQAALLASPSARLRLARQAAAAVRDRGADGINLDFEPIASGHTADFTAFVRTVRRELDRVHRGYQLTFDTTGWIGNYPIEDATARGAADAIFIMGYDYRGSQSDTAGSIDPIDGPGYSLTDTIEAYTARVPASKLILGLPYYGRAWSTTTADLRAPNQSGAKYGASTSVTYSTAAALVKLYGRRYDATEGVTWFAYRRKTCTTTYGCVTTWRQVYFDDAQALKARFDLVVRSRLRGAGIWALGYDGRDPAMYGAISLKFRHDTTPPEAGIAVLPATAGDAGFVVSWRAADDSAIRAFDVQVSRDGGPWTAWRSATRATSDVFLGETGHGYAFRVRATDAYGNVGAWDVGARYDRTPSLAVGGFGRVRVDGVSARVSPDTSSQKVATFASGQLLAIIGGPVGADGYTWYRVTGPLSEWNTVAFTRSGVWVAARSASTSFVGAARSPASTLVSPGIDGYRLGSGTSSIPAFSPDGNGSADGLRVAWRNRVAMDTLVLRVLRLDGTLVGSRALGGDYRNAGPQAYQWDGRLASVGAVPDGRYVLQLVGRSRGRVFAAPSVRPVTPAQVALWSTVVDRVAPPVRSASTSATRISPNGDGRFESVRFAMAAAGGVSWDVSIARQTGPVLGVPVRAFAGGGSSLAVTWNGRAANGAVVADGTYRVTARIADAAGNRSQRAWLVVVDARPAVMTATALPDPVSPDGDGTADKAVVRWAADERVTGSVSVRRGTHLVRSWTFHGAAGGAITWNGRDAHGRAVPDGTYRIRVDGLDATGNRSTVERTIVVDRTVGSFHWTTGAFYPQDADALAAHASVAFRLTRTAAVSLVILDARGLVVRTVWTDRAFAAGAHGWTWDGRVSGGAFAAPGAYSAALTVRSPIGVTVLRRTVFAGAYRVTASATTLTAGATLTVTFSSVEPLRNRPAVTFLQTGRPAVTRTATRLADGRYRVSFIVAKGSGPARAVIAATDSRGHVNRQTLTLIVR